MGKGISLEELKQRNRQKKAVKPRRQPRQSPVLKSEAAIIREWGQQLAQFERQHFHRHGKKQGTSADRIVSLVIVIFVISILPLFLYAAWEIFQVNRGNFYFWAYLSLIPFVLITKDDNWQTLGIIVLFLGFFYWVWVWYDKLVYF